jgi:hypothetical protein
MSAFPILDTKRFLFIIGSPRSGTTMLQILLGCHPDVATTVELTLFNRYVSQWVNTWEIETQNLTEKGWQQGLPFIWSTEKFESFLKEFLDRAYQSVLANKPAATHILDKHPGYSMHVNSIKRFLPGAKFIHIIRDGRDMACSAISARKKLGFGTSTVGESALAWKQYLTAAKDAARFGVDYMEVRYETLLEQKVESYSEILDFCELPHDALWVQRTLEENSFSRMKERQAAADSRAKLDAGHYRDGKAGGWRTQLTRKEWFEFHQYAGDLLIELGYAKEDWWATEPLAKLTEPLRFGLTQQIQRVRRACSSLLGSRSVVSNQTTHPNS